MKNAQLALFLGLGTLFWLNAALVIRFGGPTVFSTGSPWLLLCYGLAIPLTLVSLYLTKLISGLRYAELLRPVVVMTFTATFLDALALTRFRSLYSESFEVAMHGAAWILWGVGLGLLFSYYLEQKGGVAAS